MGMRLSRLSVCILFLRDPDRVMVSRRRFPWEIVTFYHSPRFALIAQPFCFVARKKSAHAQQIQYEPRCLCVSVCVLCWIISFSKSITMLANNNKKEKERQTDGIFCREKPIQSIDVEGIGYCVSINSLSKCVQR